MEQTNNQSLSGMTKAEQIYESIGKGYGFNGSKEQCIEIINKILTPKPSQPTGETVFRKVSVKDGLPKDGKPHYYILKDGGFATEPKYAIHKEQIKIINRECEYWLEEIPLPTHHIVDANKMVTQSGLNKEEIIKWIDEQSRIYPLSTLSNHQNGVILQTYSEFKSFILSLPSPPSAQREEGEAVEGMYEILKDIDSTFDCKYNVSNSQKSKIKIAIKNYTKLKSQP